MFQGDDAEECFIMQENERCAFLHKNYTVSIGNDKKHISVRYLFVADKIDNKEVKIISCPV